MLAQMPGGFAVLRGSDLLLQILEKQSQYLPKEDTVQPVEFPGQQLLLWIQSSRPGRMNSEAGLEPEGNQREPSSLEL